jgi:hypothetical protein
MNWLIVSLIVSFAALTALFTWLGWCLGRSRERRLLFGELRSELDSLERLKPAETVSRLKFAHCRSSAAALATIGETLRDINKRLAHAYRCSSSDPFEMSFRMRDVAGKTGAAKCLLQFLVDEHDPLIGRVSDAAQMIQGAATSLRDAIERRLQALSTSGLALEIQAARIAKLKIALDAQAALPRQQPVNALKNLAAQYGAMVEILNQAESLAGAERPNSAKTPPVDTF